MTEKNVNIIIAHLDAEIKNEIRNEIDNLDHYIQEIHDIYYDHERFFDTKWYAERLGLDNIQSSVSYELPYILDNILEGPDYKKALQEDMEYFKKVNHRMDCEGYGPNACARGFSASHPCSLLWVETIKIMRELEKIDSIIKKHI